MAEYIQLQKKYYDGIMIKEVLEEYENDYDTLLAMLNRFASMDGADVPERKTGRWKKSYADHEAFGVRPFFRYCSECHETTVYQYNYCPNCGAKMDDDKDG